MDGYAHLWDPDPKKIEKSLGDMTIGENVYYGGLLRFDLSPKPAYYTIQNLIKNVWHTEAEITSDQNGTASFHGFYGEYDVTISAGGKEVCKTLNLSSKGYNDFNFEI